MRDAIIILVMCVAAIGIGAWLYMYAPQTSQAPATEPVVTEPAGPVDVAFTAIDSGTHAAGVSARKNYAVYTEEDFTDLWKKAHGEDGKKMPAIDFENYYVIGVFAGQQPTGGYSIAVDKVTDEADTRTVSITIEKPGDTCVVTQALTNPFQLIRVPMSDLKLAKADTVKVNICE
jgi:hypothetical protein